MAHVGESAPERLAINMPQRQELVWTAICLGIAIKMSATGRLRSKQFLSCVYLTDTGHQNYAILLLLLPRHTYSGQTQHAYQTLNVHRFFSTRLQ